MVGGGLRRWRPSPPDLALRGFVAELHLALHCSARPSSAAASIARARLSGWLASSPELSSIRSPAYGYFRARRYRGRLAGAVDHRSGHSFPEDQPRRFCRAALIKGDEGDCRLHILCRGGRIYVNENVGSRFFILVGLIALNLWLGWSSSSTGKVIKAAPNGWRPARRPSLGQARPRPRAAQPTA